MVNLAEMYGQGWGVASDRGQEQFWLESAVALGDRTAAGRLAQLSKFHASELAEPPQPAPARAVPTRKVGNS